MNPTTQPSEGKTYYFENEDPSNGFFRGELLYGEVGPFTVEEQTPTGRFVRCLGDEYLAMQCAVSLGTVVQTNKEILQ